MKKTKKNQANKLGNVRDDVKFLSWCNFSCYSCKFSKFLTCDMGLV